VGAPPKRTEPTGSDKETLEVLATAARRAWMERARAIDTHRTWRPPSPDPLEGTARREEAQVKIGWCDGLSAARMVWAAG
jgi:hypothetical protein